MRDPIPCAVCGAPIPSRGIGRPPTLCPDHRRAADAEYNRQWRLAHAAEQATYRRQYYRSHHAAPRLRFTNRNPANRQRKEGTMTRITITEHDEATGELRTLGWFDASRAESFAEDTHFDGHNHVSLATGSQWDHERLYRTAGGRWAVLASSQWQGSRSTWRFVEVETARAWLAANGHDDAISRLWPQDPDEDGPTGDTPRRTLRIPDDLWVAIQRHAAERSVTATQVVLDAVRAALDG